VQELLNQLDNLRLEQYDNEMKEETPKGDKIDVFHEKKVNFDSDLSLLNSEVKARSHSFYIV
jgi:hypothetical protein